jgi:hypothetical protein
MPGLELLEFIHSGGPRHGMFVWQRFQSGIWRLMGGMDEAFIGISADFHQGLQALQGFIAGKGCFVHGRFRLEGQE